MINAVFLLLCAGQLAACMKSFRVMVLYYLFAGSMAYFTLPYFGNFDTYRVCGIMVIFCSLVKYRWAFRDFFDNSFMLYIFYVIAVMAVMAFYWPLENFQGSPIHREYRVFVQLLSWVIYVMLGALISWIYISKEDFDFFVNGCKYIALFHCFYGIYQFFAYKYNLPMTGIIRNNIVDNGLEELAEFNLGGDMVFRVTSFAGEPKTLASLLLAIAGLIMAQHLSKKKSIDFFTVFVMTVMGICYFMTYSTSSYLMLGGLILLYLWCKDIRELRIVALLGAIAVIFLIFWGDKIGDIMEVRFYERIEGEQDPPVACTMELLTNSWSYLILGLGSGGISFYLADMLGDLARYRTHTPNIGIVYMLSESGIIGLILLIVPFLGVWFRLLTKQLKNEHFRSIVFISLFFMLILLVRSAPYTIPFIYGSFIAVCRMSRSMFFLEEEDGSEL